MKQWLCMWAAVASVSCLACAGPAINKAKFQAVDRAGQLLQQDVRAAGGRDSSQFPDLLERFQGEIVALDGRTNGRNEADALKAYGAARDSYAYFLRFQRLDRDAVGGMVLLTGANRPVASRYGLPMENRGGGRWVNRKIAMETFIEKAEAELNKASRMVNGS